MAARFLTRAEVAAELNVSESQVYALIRRRDLRAMKVGGRGDYRVGRDDLELFIAHGHEQTAEWIETHPFSDDDEDPDTGPDVGEERGERGDAG